MRFWVPAYNHDDFVHDAGKVTSNAAEQENKRMKTLGIRSMRLLDFLDAMCKLVQTTLTKFVLTAVQRQSRSEKYTKFAQQRISAAYEEARPLYVEADTYAAGASVVVGYRADQDAAAGLTKVLLTQNADGTFKDNTLTRLCPTCVGLDRGSYVQMHDGTSTCVSYRTIYI
jgi:hypothetical protein